MRWEKVFILIYIFFIVIIVVPSPLIIIIFSNKKLKKNLHSHHLHSRSDCRIKKLKKIKKKLSTARKECPQLTNPPTHNFFTAFLPSFKAICQCDPITFWSKTYINVENSEPTHLNNYAVLDLNYMFGPKWYWTKLRCYLSLSHSLCLFLPSFVGWKMKFW